MKKKILILSGSPKKKGNTAVLISHFCQSIDTEKFFIDIIEVAFLKYKVPGCSSCRLCQSQIDYGCVVQDDARHVLLSMVASDIIVMATPLYFFGPSAQMKIIVDRMFSLYKWDNDANTMETPLKGKKLVLMGSAFENIGLDALMKPFELTAEYTGIRFSSLIIPNAGVSGALQGREDVKLQVQSLCQNL